MSAFDELTLDISQSVDIQASVGDVWSALMRRLGNENSSPDNNPMPMVLEEWPGGRWFRDLGNGQGHLWGFVQVIKPPNLIELHGPMFMSYAVSGHIQWRLTQIPSGTELSLRHQVLGAVLEEHRQGVVPGWSYMLKCIKDLAEQ